MNIELLTDAVISLSKLQLNRSFFSSIIMQTRTLESVTQLTLINFISAYQQHISPKKGFACPHRLLHGGESCSDYIKRILSEQDLVSSVRSSIDRFQNCTQASKTLTSTHTNTSSGCIVIPCCLPI